MPRVVNATDGYWHNPPWFSAPVGGAMAAKTVSDSDGRPRYHIFGMESHEPIKVHDNLRVGICTDGEHLVLNGTIGAVDLVNHVISIKDLCADEETLRINPHLGEFLQNIISTVENLNTEPDILVIDLTGMSGDNFLAKLSGLFGIDLSQEPTDRPDEQFQ